MSLQESLRAHQIVIRMAKKGITLSLKEGHEGTKIVAKPPAAITPENVEVLKANEAGLVEVLKPANDVHHAEEGWGEHSWAYPRIRRAARLGLVARWSREFGYVSVHDPTSGEWHDVAVGEAKGAAPWMLRESGTRKDLWRASNRKAFDLNAREMEEIWRAEHPGAEAQEEEGIVEEYSDDLE